MRKCFQQADQTRRPGCEGAHETLFSICQTEPNEATKEANCGDDPFSRFFYQDHITRHRYQISNLKKQKRRYKTQASETKTSSQSLGDSNFLHEGLKLLQNINQNRKKDLIEEFKEINSRRRKKHSQQLSNISRDQIERMKKRIKREVLGINQNFLREYLYHNQPFNQLLVDINHSSDSNIINQKRIDELKEKIISCIKKKPEERLLASNKMKKISTKTAVEVKANKDKIAQSLDRRFDRIWTGMQGEISRKVRMEGEFNWARR